MEFLYSEKKVLSTKIVFNKRYEKIRKGSKLKNIQSIDQQIEITIVCFLSTTQVEMNLESSINDVTQNNEIFEARGGFKIITHFLILFSQILDPSPLLKLGHE